MTVNVDEYQPINVAVIGEVSHPGSYPLEATSGVMQALASAGGMTEYASRDRIFVLRKTPALRRIRFTFDCSLERTEVCNLRPPDGRRGRRGVNPLALLWLALPTVLAMPFVDRSTSRTVPKFAAGISVFPMTPR